MYSASLLLSLIHIYGIKGERFAETIERIGFENVEKQLLG